MDALLTHYGQRMRQKLGFFTEQKDDNVLLNELFSLMAREGSDYSRTFRMLSHTEQQSASSPLRDTFIDRAAFDAGSTATGRDCAQRRWMTRCANSRCNA